MNRIVIEGGRALKGKIMPQGSKNAALPILFATILIKGISIVENVPNIGDVDVVLQILKDMGAKIERSFDSVIVDTRKLYYKIPDKKLVKKIRASSYLIGACLSRFGKAEIMEFGGCNFDSRPIDLHIYAAERLGADFNENGLVCKKMNGTTVNFPKASVGATINTILMAVSAPGETVIIGGAREPHVFALIDFLRSAGADIIDNEKGIYVRGKSLHDAYTKVIPDSVELGTYIYSGLVTGGAVETDETFLSELEVPLNALIKAGASIVNERGVIRVSGEINSFFSVETEPYPGYPTDMQPQTVPIMAKHFGGKITENVWLGRFGYLKELLKFGVGYEMLGNSVKIFPSELKSASVSAPDLRGGAACVMCALAAKGVSEIYAPEVIFRGYSRMIGKFSALGANIKVD